MALFATTTSCEPKNNAAEAVAVASITGTPDADFPATSVGVKLNMANIESYVFIVDEGADTPAPDPVVMYAEAKEKVAAADGETITYVYGMEGEKDYTIHYAFKVRGENRYITQSLSTKTKAYDRMINIVSADRFSVKVQFNVPAGQHFRYLINDHVTYYDLKLTSDDVSMLKHGIVKQGPQVITYADGGPSGYKDPMTGEDILVEVKPGCALVVIMAFCDADGNIKYEIADQNTGGGPLAPPAYASSNKPNTKEYTEVCEDKHYTLTDPYAKQFLVTAQPLVGEGQFSVEAAITELSSSFRITPPPSVLHYGAMMMTENDYQEQINILGEDGVMEYIQRNMKPMEGIQIISNNPSQPLIKDVNYKLFLIGLCDKTGDTQLRNLVEFKAIVSPLPASELVVTNVTDPKDGPYQIKYNIKATNGDCVAAKYVCNYVKEIEPMFGSGTTYEDIIFGLSYPMDQSWIDAINSAEGLTLPFDSFEDMDNRIIVASFNEHEKMKIFTKDARSGIEPAKEKVTSALFSELLGQWDVKMTYYFTSEAELTPVTSTFVTTITDAPAASDPAFGPNHANYNEILGYYIELARINGIAEADRRKWATDLLNSEYDKYNVAQPKFAKKYSDQNRLVMNGFEYVKNGHGLNYNSSWDLFCNLSYASYDIDQMFFDYGPKLFLEIAEGDKVTLETNPTFIAPFVYHSAEFLVGGFADNAVCFNKFDVTMVTKDSMVINHKTTFEGKQYPFAIVNTARMPEIVALADITLKKRSNSQQVVGRNSRSFNSYSLPDLSTKPRRTKITPVVKSPTPIEIPISRGFLK